MATKYSATIPLGGLTHEQFQMLVSYAFERLGWPQFGIAEHAVTARTSMADNAQEIIVTVNAPNAEILSKLSGAQIFDIKNKNEKNVNQLVETLEAMRAEFTPEQLDEQYNRLKSEAEEKLMALQERIEQGTLTADDKLALSYGGTYVTYTLIAINVLVFIAMLVSGVSIMNPSAVDILNWGGNIRSYTAAGDWWRLITCVFVHIGIIHLLFNMYALFSVGRYLEPIMGRWKFLAAYLATGVLASATSIWWADNRVSAGASGAIFGMYGLFLALLTTNYVHKETRKAFLQSILVFVGYNLVYGMKGGVDNSAHIGGLVSGFVLGYIFFVLHAKQNKPQLFIPAAIALAAIISIPVLNKEHDDTTRFGLIWEQAGAQEEKALAPLREGEKMAPEEFVHEAETVSLPAWNEMKSLMDKTKNYHLPAELAGQRTLMNKYIDLRIQQTQSWIQLAKTKDTATYLPRMDSLGKQIEKTLDELSKE